MKDHLDKDLNAISTVMQSAIQGLSVKHGLPVIEIAEQFKQKIEKALQQIQQPDIQVFQTYTPSPQIPVFFSCEAINELYTPTPPFLLTHVRNDPDETPIVLTDEDILLSIDTADATDTVKDTRQLSPKHESADMDNTPVVPDYESYASFALLPYTPSPEESDFTSIIMRGSFDS